MATEWTLPTPAQAWVFPTGLPTPAFYQYMVHRLGNGGLVPTPSESNIWSGTNDFVGPFQIQGVTQTFPLSGNLVGTDDPQTLTNKSIDAAEIDSGTLAPDRLPHAATGQKQVAAPVAPSSTTLFTMQGLAGAITPVTTGNVLFIISGTFIATTVTAGDGIEVQLSYGLGTAPVNGAALAGFQAGTVRSNKNPTTVTAADVAVAFSVQAVATGLMVDSPYWIDLAAKSIATASSGAVTNVSVSAFES
jgi:hypothetical protein